ncbi:MAG TPA: aspartyl/asparaginyl beta-hydroxylase domain-containing protein [Caulobacteraceae bacterium]|nr:aspartyl/asparaginyl beta-hydroxylase domain-containing protein [Caulobacteraceae bacterium]
MSTLPVSRPSALRRLRDGIVRFVRGRGDALERWLASKSLVETSEIISPAAFPWVAELEANWRTIRAELVGVLGDRAALPAMQDISPLQGGIVQERVWKVFAFHAYGVRCDENCRRCPETAGLLDAIPDLEVAFFSVLEPGAHLSAHRGAYKGLVRAHLGVMVPEPRAQVRMQVGQQTVVWEEGRCVLFDDTYRHEVWNDTDGVRVVLLIDVPRPFPPLLARINRTGLRLARLTPFVADATRKLRAWEAAYYKTGTAAGPG